MKNLTLKEVLKEAWKAYKSRPWFCIAILLLTILLAFAAEKIDSLFVPYLGLGSIIFATLAGVFLNLGQSQVALGLLRGENVGFKTLFSPWRKFPRALGQHILFVMAVLAGLLLLIVPGIIVYIGLAYAILSIVDKDASLLGSLSYSWRITKGYRFKIFLYLIALFFLNILGTLCLIIGLLVTLPLSSLAMTEIYRRLSEGEDYV